MSRYWGTHDPKPDVQCEESGCDWQAVEQDQYDGELCEWHLREAQAADAADLAVKYAKENAS